MAEVQPSIAQIDSPTKTPSQNCTKNNQIKTRADDYFGCSSLSAFSPNLSLTQRQILSHNVIKDVIQKSKRKTVQHHVNRIPIQTKLYNVPLSSIKDEFVFDVIPPNNKDFASSASQKVKQIHHRLADKKDLTQRLLQFAEKNINKCNQQKRSRPASADSNAIKRVSVSGLVSYSFNSVHARRSLGSIPDQPQELQLRNKLLQTKRRNSCSNDRQSSIVRRKPNESNTHRLQFKKAAVCDFHTQTEKFLKVLKQEHEKDEKIYGQRMEKLSCIKQFMQKQKVDYQQAKFIVQAILSSHPKSQKQKKQKIKIPIDDDKELSKRKQALASRRVMLKHLYFTQ